MKKTYHFYFSILPINLFNSEVFFSQSHFDYIFNYQQPFPEYIQQNLCDILPNEKGILFSQHVLNQIDYATLIKDFKCCFGFLLPTGIYDTDNIRYSKNYTINFEISQFKDAIPMDNVLFYYESPWKEILEINPDFFYLRDANQILIGSKDSQLLEHLTKNHNQ
ncbi:MAG: hypothetical protein H6586_07235 [Flavobacteriales bacterium]|nr:hypothetical protein [Flavobacteriales bacterium]